MTEPHLAADFHFLNIEQGGKRVTPIYNSNLEEARYLPHVRFKKSDWKGESSNSDYIVHVRFPTNFDIIYPGDCAPCTIQFVLTSSPNQWHLGMELLIYEGLDLVAICIVTEILAKTNV